MYTAVGGQRKARETVSATPYQLVSDPRRTENDIPKLDRSAIPLIYSTRDLLLKYSLFAEKKRIAHISAPPAPVVQEPARTGATPDAGNDPKGAIPFYVSLSI